MIINISRDFSETPGGRFISEGSHSGEEFRKRILGPKYSEAINKKEQLTIEFDGCFGYATSFLEEAFGGLVRERKEKGILKNMIFISEDDITVPRLIEKYVVKAESELK